MRKTVLKLAVPTVAALGLIGGVMAPAATAAPAPKSYPLATFDGTMDGGGMHGVATKLNANTYQLDNNDGDSDPNNNYSGVYLKQDSLQDKPVSDVTLHFSYVGDVSGGSPRFSIPLGDSIHRYLFVDAASNPGSKTVELTDTTWVSTYTWSGTFGEFKAKNADAAVHGTAFIIADQPGIVTISNIYLGARAAGK